VDIDPPNADHGQLESDGLRLQSHLALPERTPSGGSPGLVICHGFPTVAIGAERSGQSYHSLADRIAAEKGNAVMAMHYRGCGGSEGHFSLRGWLNDVEAAIDALNARDDVSSVSLMGFGTGAALVICAAASRPEVRSVAAIAPPADFSDWSGDPERLLVHARRVGAITDEGFPQDFDAWADELGEIRAVASAAEMANRPLLILHGQDDDMVPIFDSRIVADAHGAAELRIIQGAGHLLRYDPRAVAILFGWIDRQRFSNSMA
jgi:pimeloyl-ACP methyl ester carboxylesterase